MELGFFASRLAAGGAVLGPMAGYTDAPFRWLCRAFGSAWSVTEMVSAQGLVQSGRGIELGAPYPGEPDLVIQLFASEPDVAGEAAALLARAYAPAALDLNLGCPVRKIVRKGCGAALMQDPELAAEIVGAMTSAASVPVSVKMRLGFQSTNVLDVAQAVEAAGAAAVAIHGRTAVQKYAGCADWEAVSEVASRVSIPVIGSGDVTSREQFTRYQARGLGVMVARACIGRPWFLAELRGEAAPDAAAMFGIAYLHAQLHVAWYGPQAGLRALRGHLVGYLAHASGSTELRPRLMRVDDLQGLAELIREASGIDPRDRSPILPLPCTLEAFASNRHRPTTGLRRP